MKYILTSNTLTQKSDVYGLLLPWLGEGLLTSNGEKWHQRRKMITPTFHFKILQEFYKTMNFNCHKFVDKMKKISNVGNTIIDIQNQVHFLTLDIICGRF